MTQIRPRRSMLFLPGLRTDRYAKAVGSGADIVCLDLEDAVAPSLKAQAREAVLPLLNDAARGPSQLALRINTLYSQNGASDIVALAQIRVAPDILILPKVKSAKEVLWLESMLPQHFAEVDIFAIIETAEGLESAPQIAVASPRVRGLLFGAADLSAELGCELAWEPLLYARSRVVNAAAIAGIDIMDVPHLDLDDEDGLRREVTAVRRLGFTGKAAIHPKQVGPVNDGFSPTAAEVAAAQRVLDAFDACQDGVCLLDGKLVELPLVRAARRTIVIASAVKAGLANG